MIHRTQIWKRKEYTPKYCNTLVNLDYTRQYCIMSVKALWENVDRIRELHSNPKNDFLVLDNSGNLDDLCRVLDGLGFGSMKCYIMDDCDYDDLLRYFNFLYKSTEAEVIYAADNTPHTTSSEPVEVTPV